MCGLEKYWQLEPLNNIVNQQTLCTCIQYDYRKPNNKMTVLHILKSFINDTYFCSVCSNIYTVCDAVVPLFARITVFIFASGTDYLR